MKTSNIIACIACVALAMLGVSCRPEPDQNTIAKAVAPPPIAGVSNPSGDEKPQEIVVVTGVITAVIAIISAAITTGVSLVGGTVHGLMQGGSSIAVAGSVENYSEWPLTNVVCTARKGKINIPLSTVLPGQKEGFASHKTAHRLAGTWMHCSMKAGTKMMFHFMYSIPYSHLLYSNTLAIAVCAQDSHTCNGLDADKMYNDGYWFMQRLEYHRVTKDMKMCNGGVCIVAKMGTSHRPTVKISVYPEDYNKTSAAVKAAFVKNKKTDADWDTFVNGYIY